MQGPHGALGQNGSPGTIATQTMTPHWQQQLLKCEVRVFFCVIATMWYRYSAFLFVYSPLWRAATQGRLTHPFVSLSPPFRVISFTAFS